MWHVTCRKISSSTEAWPEHQTWSLTHIQVINLKAWFWSIVPPVYSVKIYENFYGVTFPLGNSSPALCDAGQAGHFVRLRGACDAWLTNWIKLYSTSNYHLWYSGSGPWTLTLTYTHIPFQTAKSLQSFKLPYMVTQLGPWDPESLQPFQSKITIIMLNPLCF